MMKCMIMNRRGANTYKKAPTMKFWAVFFCAFVTFPVNTKSFLAQQLGSRGRIESSRIVRSSSSSMEITIKDQPPLTEISAAELVARASNFQEVMVAIDSLAFPGEEKLHYQLQLVHQRKRQKVATNALKRLVKFLIGVSVETDRLQLIYSEKFYRLCVCATSSMTDNSSEEVTAFWLTRSDVKSYLEAIYSLGALAPLPQKVIIAISPLLQQLDRCCIDRDQGMKESIEQLPYNLKLKATEISSLDWAINRIYCDSSRQREPSHVMGKSISQASNAESITRAPLSEAKNILARREQLQLPFSILHGLVKGVTNVEEMRKMVPFKAETLQTKDGKTVAERRETCWMADEGIGGLAYSGKIMAPVSFTRNVAAVRDAIEKETGIYYDCCLINWYDDGECACKMHSDPDHGRLWSHDTVVVSIGETRRFNLREIPSNVLPNKVVNKNLKGSESKSKLSLGGSFPETEQEHHSFHLYDGDVFYMKDDCQDTFQHCVMKSEGPTNNSPRSSIVFKKSLPGLGGKRGHGLVKIKPDLQKKNSGTTFNRLDSAKGKKINNIKNSKSK